MFQMNAAKRDAFFRGTEKSETASVKFDSSLRYASSYEKERAVLKDSNQMMMEKERDRDRERKYGGESRKEMEGYVGFANLPNQIYRRSVKRGFEFTLMVVGEWSLSVRYPFICMSACFSLHLVLH